MFNRIIHKEKRPYRKVRIYCFGGLKKYTNKSIIYNNKKIILVSRKNNPMVVIDIIKKDIKLDGLVSFDNRKLDTYKFLYRRKFNSILKSILKDGYKLIGHESDYILTHH